MKNQLDDVKSKYISLFNDFKNRLNGEKSGPIHEARQNALKTFTEVGFPTLRMEDWRFTDISPILRNDFTLPELNALPSIKKGDISNFLCGIPNAIVLVFLNGIFVESLSTRIHEGSGSIHKEILNGNPDIISHLAKYAASASNAFTALNAAFTYDGAFIRMPDGEKSKPVHLLFLADPKSKQIVYHPHNIIIAGKNSNLTIIEHYAALKNDRYFTNSVTEIFANENSSINHIRLQFESEDAFHIGSTYVSLSRSSSYSSHSVNIGGEISRHDLNVVLAEEGASTDLYGLYMLTGKQLSDTHTFIDHTAPHCTSQEHYKGILDENSHGVFNGKILVRKGAQQTNSYQENRNIILSSGAKVDTKPQLEIFADDVKCSHGATVGQLSADSIFYMRSRGISEETARLILIHAFASDVLNNIKINGVRKYLEQFLSSRFLPEDRTIQH
ncbi:MAG: Fe-S cluster assembly protein SufD [Candidatus Kryptoniota bacterium]